MLLLHSLLFLSLGISVLAIPISPMLPRANVPWGASLSQKIKGKFQKMKGKLNLGKHVVSAPQAAVNVQESRMNGLWHAEVAPNLLSKPGSGHNRVFYIQIEHETMVDVWPKEKDHDNLYELVIFATKKAWVRVENPRSLRVSGPIP